VEVAEYEPRNERRNACRGTRKASSPAGRLPNSPQARTKPREGVKFWMKFVPTLPPFYLDEICSIIVVLRPGLFLSALSSSSWSLLSSISGSSSCPSMSRPCISVLTALRLRPVIVNPSLLLLRGSTHAIHRSLSSILGSLPST